MIHSLIYCFSIQSLVFDLFKAVFVGGCLCGKLFCGALWGIVGESVYFYIKITVEVK